MAKIIHINTSQDTLYSHWTQSAVDCYESNFDCSHCQIPKIMETPCKMKESVKILYEKLGEPSRYNTSNFVKFKGDNMIEMKIVIDDLKYLPTYANSTDACMDLRVKLDKDIKVIQPHEVAILDTGVKVAIPEDHVMMIFPRSSTGFKLKCQLANSTGIIDSGYRDEIKMAIYNFSDKPVEIKDAQRIAQFIVIPRPKINLNIVKDNDKFRNDDRGGGIGSTGE